MSEKDKFSREFEKLLVRQMDGDLSEAELLRLRELLRADPQARETYLRLCQIDAMLEDERGGVLKALVEEAEPENVVPLPGLSKARQGDVVIPPRAVPHGRYAAVACAMGGLIVAGLVFIDRERNKSAALTEKEGPPAPEVTPPASPEEEYRQKLVAMSDGGSQNRPPTPFVSNGGGKAPGEVDFNRDVRPILSDNCFLCHGPSDEDRKADLRLDTPEGIVADLGGYAAVVPGNPDKSALIERILVEDPDEVMPPPKSHKKLTASQKDTLRRWIAQGGVWRDHWAFEPVERPAYPEAKAGMWGKNGIDRFILARLEKEGIEPAPEADRRTLARRVSLDVTGLPPTPEAVEDFVRDESANAYESLVDRYLESERYGEHRARYWLDAARYGDTHGLHLDNYREIWPYRDWVIGAFNSNMPFDQFTIEQIAGDLLPDPTQDQRVATGFNRCNVTTSEGGSIAEEYAVRYAVDRVETTSTVWMGLTTGCAVCHDHKYDPLSMKEFYQLFAYFNNTTQSPMDGNIEDTPPVIRLYESVEDEAKEKKLRDEIKGIEGELSTLRKEADDPFLTWLQELSKEEAAKENRLGLAGGVLAVGAEDLKDGAKDGAEGEMVQLDQGAELAFGKARPFTIRLRYRYPEEKRGRWTLISKTDSTEGDRGIRVVLDGQGISVELIDRWPEHALQMVARRGFSAGAEKEIFVTYDGSQRAEGIMVFQGGKELGNRYNMVRKNDLETDFGSGAPFRVAVPGTYAGEPGVGVSKLEIFDRQLSDGEILALSKEGGIPKSLTKAKAHLERKNKGKLPDKGDLLAYYMFKHSPEYARVSLERAGMETSLDQVLSRTTTTLVMQEKQDGETVAHILERGEYDKPGEEVRPGVPAVLPALPADAPPNRLGLANWLVDPGHPLTARVTVNRMWQELFGTGLVKTSEDFGAQGEPPSHPELLDWLAAEFVENGWDMKALYKSMLMSAAYRQSSKSRPELADLDPENRLIARGPRFRLDAETIRDQALFVSGLLVDRVGGASVKPYQPAGLWKTVGYSGSNTVEFHQDHGDALYRRSMYTFWKRTSHPPNMAAFDAPNRESCTVRRERTNTPLQALVLMNDPQYVEAALHLAERVLMEKSERPLDRMFRIVLGRPASKDEKRIVAASLKDFREAYASDGEAAGKLISAGGSACREEIEPRELAAWTMLANQLLNLDEVINKN